jgi:hypothetical protein
MTEARKRPSPYKYKADQRKREGGILLELNCDGDYPVVSVVQKVGERPTYLVAYANNENPAFELAYERNAAEWRKVKEAGGKSEAELSTMLTEVFDKTFVEVCMLDWYNQEDEHGRPWSFSKEAAAKYLSELPEIEGRIVVAAQDRRHFRIDLPGSVEADAKNS